jgi:hypothetical protein
VGKSGEKMSVRGLSFPAFAFEIYQSMCWIDIFGLRREKFNSFIKIFRDSNPYSNFVEAAFL